MLGVGRCESTKRGHGHGRGCERPCLWLAIASVAWTLFGLLGLADQHGGHVNRIGLLTQEEVQRLLKDPGWVLVSVQRASIAGVGRLEAGLYSNERLSQAFALGIESYPSMALARMAYKARLASPRVQWGDGQPGDGNAFDAQAPDLLCGRFVDDWGDGWVCMSQALQFRDGAFGLIWDWTYTAPPSALPVILAAQVARCAILPHN